MKPGSRISPETSTFSRPSYRPRPATCSPAMATSTSRSSPVNTECTRPPDSTTSAGSSPRATARRWRSRSMNVGATGLRGSLLLPRRVSPVRELSREDQAEPPRDQWPHRPQRGELGAVAGHASRTDPHPVHLAQPRRKHGERPLRHAPKHRTPIGLRRRSPEQVRHPQRSVGHQECIAGHYLSDVGPESLDGGGDTIAREPQDLSRHHLLLVEPLSIPGREPPHGEPFVQQ